MDAESALTSKDDLGPVTNNTDQDWHGDESRHSVDEADTNTGGGDPSKAQVSDVEDENALYTEDPVAVKQDGEKQEKEDKPSKRKTRRLEALNDELRSRIEKLEKKAEDSGDEGESKEDSKDKYPGLRPSRLRSVPKINCMTVEEYKKRKFEYDKPHYTIDAVMSDGSFRSSKPKETSEPTAGTAASPNGAGPAPVPQMNETYELVRFIQINSQALATEVDLYDEVTGDNIVIFSPFKSLTYRERQMRETLARLEQKWGGATWQTVDAEADAASKDAKAKAPASPKSSEDVDKSASGSDKDGEPVLPQEQSTSAPEIKATDVNGVVGESQTDEGAKDSPGQHQEADGQTQGSNREESSPKVVTDGPVGPIGSARDDDSKPQADESKPAKDDELEHLKLRTLTNEDRGSDGLKAYEDLKCLLEFYEEYVKPRWDYLRSNQVKQVRYGDLCTIFQPGDEVVQPDQPQKVWRVLKITGGRPRLEHLYTGDFNRSGDSQTSIDSESGTDKEKVPQDDKETKRSKRKGGEGSSDRGQWSIFHIDGYYIDFNGKDFGAVHIHTQIVYFSGLRDVKSIRPHPLRFADNYDSVRRGYMNLGRRFLELTHMKLRYYDGRTLIKKPNNAWLAVAGHPIHRPEDISSQVVIDMEKAFQYNLDWTPDFYLPEFAAPDKSEWETKDLDDKDPIKDPERQYLDYYDNLETKRYRETDDWVPLTGDKSSDDRERFNENENDLLILPDRVYGFVLRSRRWACFDIQEKLLQPVRKDDAYEELQLPEGHKRTLESLVERHFNNKEAVQNQGKKSIDFDFVQGKGLGLIVLLHGSPGVGKTSTAEAIAGKYDRPLLPITCGNLGIDAESVEDKLTENFALAQAWDCIVLLDEADVFLVKRDKNDLKRNALVSVFLRTLEYYTGVLFLTTNRTGAFDEAFRSRIHTALFYPDLGREETRKIWKSNLRRLLKHKESNQQKLVVNEDEIISYALVHYDWHCAWKRPVWNGRQIRNSFQTAVALAEFDAKEEREEAKRQTGAESRKDTILKWEHFKAIAKASADFENYLHDTRGMSESDMADWEGVRANYPSAGNMSDRFAGRPRNETYSAVGDLHPNMIIQPQSSVANNPFADRPPQKKTSLNQRTPGVMQAPSDQMYSSQPQMPQQYDQGYPGRGPSSTPMHNQSHMQPQQHVLPQSMYYTNQINPQAPSGQPIQSHQAFHQSEMLRRASQGGLQQAQTSGQQYPNYQQPSQPMVSSYGYNQSMSTQQQNQQQQGQSLPMHNQQQPMQSPPVSMSYAQPQPMPMQQQQQPQLQPYTTSPPPDAGQATGGAQQRFDSFPS